MYIRSNHLQTISASCHNANDIEKANKLNLDFIFLSPVLYKKDSRKILTWKSFKKLTKIAHMPVFALGGLKDKIKETDKSIKKTEKAKRGVKKSLESKKKSLEEIKKQRESFGAYNSPSSNAKDASDFLKKYAKEKK